MQRRDPPALVLVHGLVVSSRYLRPAASELARFCRVHAPDLPGFGASENPPRPLTLAGLADSLAASLAGYGLARASFLGNSFGCQIAVELAVRRPELVERLVLVGPTVDPLARSLLAQTLRWLAEAPRQASMAHVLVADFVRAGPRRLVWTLGEMLGDRVEEKLPRVEAPALVVRGARDRIVPQRWAEEAAALLPRGRLVVLPGAGHVPNWNAPGALADAVRPFLLEPC